MSQQGWIKLHRQIQDSFLWQDKPFNRKDAWIDLLLLANHEDKTILFNGQVMVIKRGQFLTSIRKLADRWGWSRDRTLKFFKLLESEQMVDRDSDSNRTLLTIVNYDNFQGETDSDKDSDKDSNKDSERTLTRTVNGHRQGQWHATNKNVKNEKNDKNVKNEKKNNIRVYFPDDKALNDAFKDFVDMRKKLKKPLASDRAITLAINKLNKLSNGDSQLAIDIIEQSIMGSWLSFYPLTERKGERPNSYMEAINNRVNVVDSWLDDNDEGTV